ncbi:hypothetical protein CQ009_13085 [Pseudomonas sp. MYb2]|uniref:hypothetical protein n=1 Tax=unclassified Pseudomonas TaxID=196821 RepID=UPI000D00E38B|nr:MULTISPECIES: hypothetical protein [unclassified Pseudomonas]PRB51211.1 hypothetical protein CQ025_09730 [Pseudomonas sp. MYb3]PRC34590.1 hypothetical protein CQ009_13085 [Pseudomonas sp. MYb2]
MISLNLNAVRTKQGESDRIAAATADFWSRPGSSFKKLPPARMKPKPERRDWVDPETVLKRRPKPISAADRKALRKMADSL